MADEGTQVASVAACAWPIGVTANVAGPVSTSRAGDVSDRQLVTMPAAKASAGSGVGEVANCVSSPPFTANAATTLAALPSTSSWLP